MHIVKLQIAISVFKASPMHLKLFDNSGNSGHRKNKLFVDSLVAFMLTMLSYYVLSNLLFVISSRQFKDSLGLLTQIQHG